MTSPLDGYDGAADQSPLSPELEALIERIETDSVLWEAHAPADDGRLNEYARQVAGGVLEALRPAGTRVAVADAPIPAPSAVPPTIQARRKTGPAAYLATLVVVALLASLFTYLAVQPHAAESTGVPAPTATATAMTVPTATASPQVTATAGSGTTGGGQGASGYPVSQVILGTSPTTWANDHCDATMPFTLMVTFWFPGGEPAGTVRYRWLRSDGYVGPVQHLAYSAGQTVDTDPTNAEWDIPATSADGTDKWVAVEVLSPNALTSARTVIQATCTFTVNSSSATVTSGGDGQNPPSYSCQAGGDQTFTFGATISASPGPGSHTLQYHWQRSDGTTTTTSPTYSVTFPPGATAEATQSDSWTIHQTDANSGSPRTDQVIVDSAPGTASYPAQFSKFC